MSVAIPVTEAALPAPAASTAPLAIAGAGAIARVLAEGIAQGAAGHVHLAAIGMRAGATLRGARLAGAHAAAVCEPMHLADHAGLVIEAAGGDVVRACARTWLARADVMILSAGALIDDAFRHEVLAIAQAHGHRVLVPSGAIAGIDALRAAAIGGLTSLTLRTTKPPRGLAGAPHVVANGIDLDALTAATTIFRGSVADAVRAFPSNVNVAAVLALATHDVAVAVEVVADPQAQCNIQEIDATGTFGTLRIRLENQPSPANPRTSLLAPLSALAMLRRRSDTLWIGA